MPRSLTLLLKVLAFFSPLAWLAGRCSTHRSDSLRKRLRKNCSQTEARATATVDSIAGRIPQLRLDGPTCYAPCLFAIFSANLLRISCRLAVNLAVKSRRQRIGAQQNPLVADSNIDPRQVPRIAVPRLFSSRRTFELKEFMHTHRRRL